MRHALKERGELVELRKAVQNPQFWKFQHFSTGMYIRNTLRRLGYGEEDVKSWNLDDHYVPVMLLAVGFEVEGGYNPWLDGQELVDKLVKAGAA